MSKTIITAHIVDQTVQLSNLPKLASGSVDVVQIQCDFCPLWDGYGKTAVFYKEKSQVYHILLVDDLVTIPHEMLAEEGSFFFGVMGVADDTRTTEVLRLKVVQGAITVPSAESQEPTPNIYKQIMARIDQLVAMRSTGGAMTYVLSDEYIFGKIVSNGTSAFIEFAITGMSLVGGGHHYSDYCIIPALAPLCQMELRCSNPDINVTLEMPAADSEGWARLLIENVGNTMLTTDEINTASTVYPLASVSIAELADIRVGYDGTAYATAGDAVRAQACRGHGGDDSALYLYGTPSESGNIGLRVGDTVTYYKGAVLPKIPSLPDGYPNAHIVHHAYTDYNPSYDQYLVFATKEELRIKSDGNVGLSEAEGADGISWHYRRSEANNYGGAELVWSGWSSDQTLVSSYPPIWANYAMLSLADGSIYLPKTDHIPVGEIVDYINNIPIYEVI